MSEISDTAETPPYTTDYMETQDNYCKAEGFAKAVKGNDEPNKPLSAVQRYHQREISEGRQNDPQCRPVSYTPENVPTGFVKELIGSLAQPSRFATPEPTAPKILAARNAGGATREVAGLAGEVLVMPIGVASDILSTGGDAKKFYEDVQKINDSPQVKQAGFGWGEVVAVSGLALGTMATLGFRFLPGDKLIGKFWNKGAKQTAEKIGAIKEGVPRLGGILGTNNTARTLHFWSEGTEGPKNHLIHENIAVIRYEVEKLADEVFERVKELSTRSNSIMTTNNLDHVTTLLDNLEVRMSAIEVAFKKSSFISSNPSFFKPNVAPEFITDMRGRIANHREDITNEAQRLAQKRVTQASQHVLSEQFFNQLDKMGPTMNSLLRTIEDTSLDAATRKKALGEFDIATTDALDKIDFIKQHVDTTLERFSGSSETLTKYGQMRNIILKARQQHNLPDLGL
jgi:hypothetical protein